MRTPGIIVAIGLMRRRVTPKGTPWQLIGTSNGRKSFLCGGPKPPISEIGGENIAGVCTPRHTRANFYDPPPTIRELTSASPSKGERGSQYILRPVRSIR